MTIKPGSVYYFLENTWETTESHFFIVTNKDPCNEENIILACANSNIDRIKRLRRNCPETTLVEIAPSEYPDFSVNSIIDCNRVIEKSIEQIISSKILKVKEEMDFILVEKIRRGIIDSPVVEKRIKKALL